MTSKMLTCAACGARLTGPLTILSGKDPAVVHPKHRDGEPLTPPGTAFKSWDPIERSFGDVPSRLEFTPQYWLNPDDLTDAVSLTGDWKRLGGCCDEAGMNGPNQVCACGAEIGTVQRDCYQARVFIPAPHATDWTEDQ